MTTKRTPRSLARLALAAALALGGLAAAAPAADAGYYTVYKCYGNISRDANDPQLVGRNDPGYTVKNQCGPGDPFHRLAVDGHAVAAAQAGQSGSYTITAPGGTLITAVSFESNLQSYHGQHFAQVLVGNAGGDYVLRQGNDGGDFGYAWTYVGGLAHSYFQSRVRCFAGTCPAVGARAHAYVRNIALEIQDPHPPSIAGPAGSLISRGWVRRRQGLWAGSSDVGSGVASFAAFVNGDSLYNAIASARVLCGGETPPHTVHLVPCHGTPNFSVRPNTARGAFHNGVNQLILRASDYAGNVTVRRYRVAVDNARPGIAFANAQDPNDPELVSAAVSDRHSGVAEAQLFYRAVGAEKWEPLETEVNDGFAQARVDSLAVPAGEYEFLASATDVAGNWALSTERADGTPMRVTMPLKGFVKLGGHLNRGGSKAQVVKYGTKAKVKGRLLDAFGAPIVGGNVTVVEHFGRGALVRERRTVATTDEKGKYRTKVPKGPSRDVEVLYGGSLKYAPAQRAAGAFSVRSGATFKTSRKRVPEGRAVKFHGKIRHGGARIPNGGKLLELQVRVKTGRWQTVGEAFRSQDNGKYKRRYRFGKQYSSDALFRFRVKVRRESKWPYKRTNTHQRKVIVEAR